MIKDNVTNTNIKTQISIDWIEFTFSGSSPVSFTYFLSRLGVPRCQWVDSLHGRYGYNKCFVFQTAFYCSCLKEEDIARMGYHVVIPSSALSFFNLEVLIDVEFSNYIKFTRLDIAFDVFASLRDYLLEVMPPVPDSGFLDIPLYIYNTAALGLYGSHVQPENITHIHNLKSGSTTYIGGTKSQKRLRIYDKQAETGTDSPWVRFEFQLRHESAHSFREILLSSDRLKAGFCQLFRTFFVLYESVGTSNITKQGVIHSLWLWILDLVGSSESFIPQKVESKEHPFYKKLSWLIKQAGPTFCYFAEFYDSWDWIDYKELFHKFMTNYKEFSHYSLSPEGKLMYDDFEVVSDSFSPFTI